MRSLHCCLVSTLLFLTAPAIAENWPHWRGPHLDSTSGETGLPTTWSSGENGEKNIRWRYDLPGPAASTPIVWGERIFVTSTTKDGEDLLVLAIGRDGKLQWTASADEGSVKVFEQFAHETNAAAPTPVTDGEHLWVLFGTANLFSFDMAGKVAWQVDLAERYPRPKTYFGLSTSPLLHGTAKGHIKEGAPQLAWNLDQGTPDVPSPLIDGGLVYLSGENGRLTVLDAGSGETVYAERVHQSQHRGSPVLADGKLYLTGTDGTVSVVRPGRTFEVLAKNEIDAGRLAASPAISDGTIYLRTYEALFAIAQETSSAAGR